jgi:hypothetical protein
LTHTGSGWPASSGEGQLVDIYKLARGRRSTGPSTQGQLAQIRDTGQLVHIDRYCTGQPVQPVTCRVTGRPPFQVNRSILSMPRQNPRRPKVNWSTFTVEVNWLGRDTQGREPTSTLKRCIPNSSWGQLVHGIPRENTRLSPPALSVTPGAL